MRIRSKILASLVVLMTAAPAFADFGVHAGLNLGGLSTTPAPTTNEYVGAVGFLGGIHYEVSLAAIGVELGAQYNQRSYGSSALGITTSTTTISYFEFPLLAKIKLGGFGIAAGPNFGFKAGASCSSNLGGTCTVDSSQISSTNLGIDAGVGYEFGAGVGSLSLAARYHMGLSNISTVAGQEAKVKGLQVIAGVSF